MNLDTILLALSAVAEFLVAGVIYFEWEGGRLDHFLEDVDLLAEDRRKIYKAFCGLPQTDPKSQSQILQEFLELGTDQELLGACDKNIRLLSRIGARLPSLRWLKRTPLDWHVAAILWIILGPYVEGRRKEAGPTYAYTFLKYALASTEHLLAQERDTWILRDPDRLRGRDVQFSREQLLAMKKQLTLSLKRKS